MESMSERIPLKFNTQLRFTNHEGGNISYIITGKAGEGGACIVYDGYYVNNAENKVSVRIKECYPFKLHISRTGNGALSAITGEAECFEEYKRRIRKSFDISNELLKTSLLTNSVSNTLDIYELNNTVYIVSSYVEGSALTECNVTQLKDAVKIVLSTAKCIEKIHTKGYLYLDVKPENIFVFDETYELIQLFDFDSIIPIAAKDNISGYRLCYSIGFAPIEQKMGILSKVGKYSDIYSIGALLFYLLFGRAPMAFDCGKEIKYNFSEMRWSDNYRDKLYAELTVFFHNTLESYYADRYQSMAQAIKQLEIIEKYSDMSEPFIHSSAIPNNEFVIGRQEEINSLIKWSQSDSRCMFVSGMGGIGKSTIVRKFLNQVSNDFDSIIYLYFNESLCSTLTDDTQFSINNCEKNSEETNNEYYKRKLKMAGRIAEKTNSILVIDNYNGDLDNTFADMLNVGWKVIVITRKNRGNIGYDCLAVERLSEIGDLHKLFFSKLGYELSKDKIYKLERIIKMAAGHTLVLELIARQIANSYLSIEQALELTEKHGFSGMAKEKIDFVKDGRRYYEKIELIIRAVYDFGTISSEKRKIMKIASLFDAPGIKIRELQELLDIESLDDINELYDTGWIDTAGGYASLHPLVQETIQQVEWNEEYRNIAVRKMTELLKIIKLNGKKEEYPKFYGRNKQFKQHTDNSDSAKRIIDKFLKKKGMSDEITHEGIVQNRETLMADKKMLNSTLKMSKSVLKYCGRDSLLAGTDIYKDLMFVTVINMPKEQEEYILNQVEKMFHDKDCINHYAIMELYDYVVYIHCQREDFESARASLDSAYQYAEKQSDNYLWGLYYDMLMDFYDAVLNGAYSYQNENQEELFSDLLDANDKAISYMKKSKYKAAKRLLVKYILGRAALLIRSNPDKAKKARELILQAKSFIKKYTIDNSEVCFIYYMAWAWYYSLCEPDKESVKYNLEAANKINADGKMSELDNIDYFIIPAANMMCELNEPISALNWLKEGIKLCETNSELIPYARKKLDLFSYQLDVYYHNGDMDGCRQILQLIDEENEKNVSIGIHNRIPDKLRKKLNSK